MNLVLVRHAIAAARDAVQWPDDAVRPLTPAGERRFRKAAKGLMRLVPTVDLVLASPFARAWRTAGILHQEAGWPEPTPEEGIEAGRSPAEGMEVVRAHLDTRTVALVGHEPNLSELGSMLLAGSATRVAFDFKKGGAACLFLETGRPGKALLRWFVSPKTLRRLA